VKRVYVDYAATTPVDPRVVQTMKPYFSKMYGNASSLHKLGREARDAIEKSRKDVADLMGAKTKEVVFTSSTTEANNTVIKGIGLVKGKGHIIASSIEHDCVLNASKMMKKLGFGVTFLPVDKYGLVNPEQLDSAIKKNTILVSVMHANNEIGTIEPVKELGKVCHEHGVLFHTDAAQSFGKIPINVKKMNIDLMSVSGHKMYGPKGIGALYIREGIEIEPLLHGGGHEFGLRSSTENTPYIVGFGKTVELRKKEMVKDTKRVSKLRDRLIEGVLKVENSHLNGHPKKRLPNNTSFWFNYIEGESLILQLDAKGIAASTSSACSSASLEPSHVLLALGLKPEEAHGSLRMSLGKWSTKADVGYILKTLPPIVNKLRKISPFKKSWKE